MHSRTVYLGVLIAVVGTLAVGAGIIVASLIVSVIGVGLLALGTFLGAKGGGLYDARPEFEAHEDVKEAIRGESHPGVAPGDMVVDEEAQQDAAETNARVRRTEARRPVVHEPMAAPMGILLVLVGVAVLVMQGTMTRATPNGLSVSLHDTYIAILVLLVGFRLATVPGRHPVAASLALACGLGLILQGTLDRTAGPQAAQSSLVGLEIAFGVVAIVAGLTALGSPRPKPEEQRVVTRR